jgi:hypothetical protein
MDNIRLYHQGPWLNNNSKSCYFRAVVKDCADGRWISTAHTRSRISCGEFLFEEGKL